MNHPALQTIDWNFQQLDVQTCLVCSSYSVMYMEMNESGHPIWSRYNVKPEGFDDIGVEEIRVNVSGLVSSTLDDLKELGGQGKARSQREAQELERVQGQGQGEELERVQVPVSEQIQEQDQVQVQVQVKPEDQVQHEHQVRPEVMDQQAQQHEHRHQQAQQQDRVQRRLFHIAEKPRQPFHGSEWAMEPSISQIGGHPSWVQDADYPECPVCSTTMKAIGQLDGELIQEYGEGVYYMFVCEPCQMTAVSYQQS
ncbi:hypothetical protein HUB98_21705 [Paenibacillus barcinonensis]|uniref:DUF1963 domain-containing protein n=2 Tax=Paenibacillus barcinonensis TaxID=198119 RepID=A0ABX6Q8R0_PAEBA|nr:hypothetical protein [Paenibacillus barcinonensis]QKS58585.1 hypothetical protein HUB98_21705 [Paenibacillus barcinonensis]